MAAPVLEGRKLNGANSLDTNNCSTITLLRSQLIQITFSDAASRCGKSFSLK
ncbi:hypothetical protein PSTG_12115 [Puccinia striiformis f. sp. tritici PST-78]|uniref:Uncharacterized protein n=1 Tax=Puccinia striiformis f. sp. tritici PST-78 TaxID=1165861 RepID=A0A0L0V5M3_9BASI|nr:hypothetical protein PSTG_12115 [Puccinia striiformis f. sp. tritici PST-78]